jgi:hypothetical protein
LIYPFLLLPLANTNRLRWSRAIYLLIFFIANKLLHNGDTKKSHELVFQQRLKQQSRNLYFSFLVLCLFSNQRNKKESFLLLNPLFNDVELVS